MNSKILFSTDGTETFEIQHSHWGYRILQVISETEAKAVSGYYATAGELIDGLSQLTIFSGDDAISVAELSQSFKSMAGSIKEHFTNYNGWQC